MTAIAEILRELIKTEGPVSVARFMQLALCHPEHGYYAKGDPLGAEGDFITAPEVSQMFGELIGLWLVDMWRAQGEPTAFTLLEVGGGRGTLMADALRASEKVPAFRAALRLRMIESNETLRAAQRDKFASFNPVFLDSLHEVEAGPLFVIANEFLDVLPIHQYLRLGEEWRERLIDLRGDDFVFVTGEAPVPLPLPLSAHFYELCPAALSFVGDVAAHIAAQGGAALFIDYGYVEPKDCSTLQSVSGHAPVSVLERPGEVDLTAHVDFAALRIAAQKQDVFVPPVVTQGDFFKALGIDVRARQLKMQTDLDGTYAIDGALRRLCDPAEMGALFKVMAIAPSSKTDIPGFP